MFSLTPKNLFKLFKRKKKKIRVGKSTRQLSNIAGSYLPMLMRTSEVDSLTLWKKLTKREQEVVALICMGHTNEDIGNIMMITTGTAKNHVEHILRKLDMPDRYAIRHTFRNWDFDPWWRANH